MENSESPTASEPGPGELLRSAREAQGISQREMAARLNWVPGFVAAIEENRFEVLRSAAFVRGYLRAYAKLVAVPEDTLMAAYAALTPQEQLLEKTPKRVESPVPQVQKMGIAIPAGVALVVLVIILLWYWRGDEQAGTGALAPIAGELSEVDAPQQAEALVQEKALAFPLTPQSRPTELKRTELSDPITSSDEELNSVDSSQAPATDAAGSSLGGDESSADAAVATIEAANPDPAPEPEPDVSSVDADAVVAPADNELAASESLDPTAQGPLQFRFSGDCWLEVRNAAGELIYADLRRAGDVLNLSGEAPFSVLLGDAEVVELDYLGQPVVIERRPGRLTAKFSVGEE